MNRRNFFSNLLKSSALAFVGSRSTSIMASSVLNKNHSSKKSYKLVREFTSARYPEKVYKSTEEFWKDNETTVEKVDLNKVLKEQGYLIKSSSRLKKDGRGLISEKVFTSKDGYLEFKRLIGNQKSTIRSFNIKIIS